MKECVHRVRSKCLVYTLACEGDEKYDRYFYVGATQDGEIRMLAAGGIRGDEQAKFLQAHPPVDVVSCHICDNPETMYTQEVLTWNLLSSRLGNLDQVRGARHNQVGEFKYAPRGWPSSPKPSSTSSSCGSPIAAPFVGEDCPKGKVGLASYF